MKDAVSLFSPLSDSTNWVQRRFHGIHKALKKENQIKSLLEFISNNNNVLIIAFDTSLISIV